MTGGLRRLVDASSRGPAAHDGPPGAGARGLVVTPSAIPEVLEVAPALIADARGRFFEAYHEARYAAAGVGGPFVQDNVSLSRGGVLRGLHLQHPDGQGKLVTVVRGEVFDVALDVRVGSPTFGRWVGATLSEDNGRQLYIPPGFAHGFAVTGAEALVIYKCTAYYEPASELTIRWDDPDVGVAWPIDLAVMSDKDRRGMRLAAAAEAGLLPRYGG